MKPCKRGHIGGAAHKPCYECEHEAVQRFLNSILHFVDHQAEDEGLWFVSETASEAYLQAALRELHARIEAIETIEGQPK